MNYTEFAQKVKSKYPEYQSVDDRSLAEKVVAKYPEYKDQVTFDEPAGPSLWTRAKSFFTGNSAADLGTQARDLAGNLNQSSDQPLLPLERLASGGLDLFTRATGVGRDTLRADFPKTYGAAKAGAQIGESLTTPKNLALLAGSFLLPEGIPARAAAAGFGASMAAGTPELYRQYRAALDRGDQVEAARLGTLLSATGVMALAGLHGGFAAKAPYLNTRPATPEEDRIFTDQALPKSPVPPERQLPMSFTEGPGFEMRDTPNTGAVERAAQVAQNRVEQAPNRAIMDQATNPTPGDSGSPISRLFDAAMRPDVTRNIKVHLGKVGKETAGSVQQSTGIDVSGFSHVIDNYAVRHMMKEHGDPRTELARGQIPITREDVLKIPEIVSSPEKVESVGKSAQGREVIRYQKEIGNQTYYVEEIRTGKKEMAAVTLYKKGAATPDATPFQVPPAQTPEAFRSPSDTNIAPKGENVKRWPPNAGAVILPSEAIVRLIELAKNSDSLVNFRKSVLADQDLTDTARYMKLNLNQFYSNQEKERAAPAQNPPLTGSVNPAPAPAAAARPEGLVRRAVTALQSIFSPAAKTERRLGGSAYAGVIRAIHTPEAETMAFDNARSRAMDQTFRDLEDRFKKVPEEQLRNFNLLRGGAQSLEGQNLQAQASGALDPKYADPRLTAAIKEASDYVFDFAQKNGVDLNYFQDYFYGVYKNPEKVNDFMDYWRSTDRYTKEKKLPTIADAAAWGLELRDPNPITNIRKEMHAVALRVALTNLKNKMLADRAGYVVPADQANEIQKKTWTQIHDPVFNGLRFDPDYAKFVNNLLETNKVSQNGILKGLHATARLAQTVKFFGSIFHMQNMLKSAVAHEAGAAFDPRGWADFARSFKPIDRATPEYREYVALGGGHRYSIESQAQQMMTGVLDHMGSVPILGRMLRIPAQVANSKWIPASPGFIRWQFDEFIPSLKFLKAQQDFSSLTEKLGRPLSDHEKIDIIRRNQNFYGEMNERLYGRSGTVTSALRILFMAPGYGEGNFRTMARAMAGDVKSAQFVMNTLFTTLTAATIGTRILTGHWPQAPKTAEDLRDLFKIKTTLKDGNGDDVFFDLMTYDKDYWSVFGNAATGQPGKIPQDLSRRVSGAVSSSFRVLTDLATLFNGGRVYDYKGTPIFFRTDPLQNKIGKFLQYEFVGAQPISLSTFRTAWEKGSGPGHSVISSIMGIRPATSEAVKRLKSTRADLYSMEDDKRNMQLHLNKLFNENPDEARTQKNRFNAEQKKKFEQLTGKKMLPFAYRQFLIASFRMRMPPRGTNLDAFYRPAPAMGRRR